MKAMAEDGVPAMILCTSAKKGSQAMMALDAYAGCCGSGYAVWIADSVADKDAERIAKKAAASGGLAIRTSWPGGKRKMHAPSMAPACVCKATLVLGGSVKSAAMASVAAALNAGRDVGALAREVGDDDATLNLTLLSGGALFVGTLQNAWDLLGGRPGGVDESAE